jgi:alkylated DNA repair dioxygenase AlkB
MDSFEPLHLADGGYLVLLPDFLTSTYADEAFATLRHELAWEQKPGLFGYPQPRLIASYGNPGVSYRYSNMDYPALIWTPMLQDLRQRMEVQCGSLVSANPSFSELANVHWNYCLANLYRSGADSMGWHADNEPEMGNIIGSLSLGATRRFRIRHNLSRQTQTFLLTHGSLLIMAGTMQQHWQHEVPKTKRPVGERINLTFRTIRSKESHDHQSGGHTSN